MAVLASPFFTETFRGQFDDLLYEVCEELQLTASRYEQACERYESVAAVLETEGSPFRGYRPRIYPQGSMRIGTTVKPVDGPHDLDFVCELSIPHDLVDPMRLIRALHSYLRGHGTYRDMVSLKNRCVRLTYANEFYMDVLPACEDKPSGETCIQVPDRAVKDWKPSNPIGFAEWFDDRCRLGPQVVICKAEPVRPQQAVQDKWPLQLAVQLIKRWRDLLYGQSDLAPISIVLTTLAASHYAGEASVTDALSNILRAVAHAVEDAELTGSRLMVCNPSNPKEDLTERWDERPEAYDAFKLGIHRFRADWSRLVGKQGNVQKELEALFGETVKSAVAKQAVRLQEARRGGLLGVTKAGTITAVASAPMAIRPNTFHGDAQT